MKISWVKIYLCLALTLSIMVFNLGGQTNSQKLHQDIITSTPDVSLKTIVYEGDSDDIEITWLTTESQPITDAQITVTLLDNSSGRLLVQSIHNTMSNGSIRFQLNYTNFTPGNYSWEMEFRKQGYQGQDLAYNVELVPHSFDISLDVEPEVVRGETMTMAAIVTYDSVNSDRYGQSANNLNLIFTVELLMMDSSTLTTIKIAQTNQHGVALITLTQEETESLEKVLSISARLEIDGQVYSAVIPSENLPIIVSGDESILGRTMEFLENNTILLAFLTVFFASSTIILLITRNKVSLKKEMWPDHEK